MRKFVFAVSALLAFPVCAQEYMPFPEARITEAQWTAYFEKVSRAHGASRRDFPAENLATFHDRNSLMLWAFTTPGHPAHPAWIARQPVVDKSGKTKFNQIGYFAGQEQLFAKLFNDYLALTERTIKNTPIDSNDEKQQISPVLSYEEAEKLVKQSSQQPGYKEYLNEFSEYSNRILLGARGGCYLLAADQVQLIIVITEKAVIDSAATDVDTEKARCYKRIYIGVEVKKPPHFPFAIQIINR
jgi:hypothetical protein